MTRSRALLPLFLLICLIGWWRLSPNEALGIEITVGIVLGLILLSALAAAVVKAVLPDGRLKASLLRLRRPFSRPPPPREPPPAR